MLRRAIVEGDTPTVAALLEDGLTASGLTHDATHSGVRDILSLVLRHGGDPNERNGCGETPLFVAVRDGRADLAETLLLHGANPNARCNAGYTVMAVGGDCQQLDDLLVQAGGISEPRILQPSAGRLFGRPVGRRVRTGIARARFR